MSSAMLSETQVGDALPLPVLLIGRGRNGAVVHANLAEEKQVDVESKRGNTVFRILLPAAEQSSAAR